MAMQDDDGGVYHKLTTLNFTGTIMPDHATADRYVIGKGTSATLNFAAVMAQASRIWEEYDAELAEDMLEAAKDAWRWANVEENSNIIYDQEALNKELRESGRKDLQVYTGEYGGSDLASNRAWAAAELYITTREDRYYADFEAEDAPNEVPGWLKSWGLAWMSLAHHLEADHLTEAANEELIKTRIMDLAQDLLTQTKSSAYRVGMGQYDFYWGSNSTVLNRAMMLLQGYRLSGESELLDAAQSKLDYILGRNPTDYSYVTGHGSKTPMHIHHRVSGADGIKEPVPGFVAGGPNPENLDEDCGVNRYPSREPALAYLDDFCSYSTNEVTINWNAPLVYVSGALQALSLQPEAD